MLVCPKLREILQISHGHSKIKVFLYAVVIAVAIGISYIIKAFEAIREFNILTRRLK